MSSSYRPSYGHEGYRNLHDREFRGPHGDQGYGNHQAPRDSRGRLPSTPYSPPLRGPPPQRPPLPQGLPPPMAYFGGDISARNDFSFRNNEYPRYPQETMQDARNSNEIAQRQERYNSRNRGNTRSRGGFVPRTRVPTSERALLKFKEGTPERLDGPDHRDGNKFIDLDDVSDSSEQSMDESDSNSSADDDETGNRQKLADLAKEKQAPKWSNPEVYTSLPPVDDDTERKRKDVVKLIRKARVTAENDKKAVPVPNMDDFISFDFLDEGGKVENAAPLNAPQQPRAFAKHPAQPVKSYEGRTYQPPSVVSQSKVSQPATTNVSSQIAPRARPMNTQSTVSALNSFSSLIEPVPLKAKTIVFDDKSSAAGKLGHLGVDRKRKREESEEDTLVAPKHKKGRGIRPNGNVLDHWTISAKANPAPWMGEDAYLSDNPSFRLHQEMTDFYNFVKPRFFEHEVRVKLLERLQKTVEHYNVTVYSFGSFAAGLYLPNADMDVVLLSQYYLSNVAKDPSLTQNKMHRLGQDLVQQGIAMPGSVEVIGKARVPLVKYVDKLTRLKVDVSFDNSSGVTANDTFKTWKSEYPALPMIATVIKQYLMMRGLNDVSIGGLGGFAVICLVVSILHNTPRFQEPGFRPEHNLGEILLEFLDFFGNRFDHQRSALRMEPIGFVDKNLVATLKTPQLDRLCILDPNMRGNDISGGTSMISLVFAKFSVAHDDLSRAMKRQGRSLLECVLGANYNEFLWHRRELRIIYESESGTIDFDDEALMRALEETIERPVNGGLETPQEEAKPFDQLRREITAMNLDKNFPKMASWAGYFMELTKKEAARIRRAWGVSEGGKISLADATKLLAEAETKTKTKGKGSKARATQKSAAVVATKPSKTQSRVIRTRSHTKK